MSDLIRRQDAIEYFMTNTNWHDEDGYTIENANEKRALLTDYFNGVSSAEPERKKGKWIPHSEKSREYIGAVLVNVEYDYFFCDTCGYQVENGQPMYNFCPNCGTRMMST